MTLHPAPCTFWDVTDRITDYPDRFWRAIAVDIAAGYERNALGEWLLIGLVVYGPSTEKLRGIRLRGLDRIGADELADSSVIPQVEPPTPDQVQQAWGTVPKPATFSTRSSPAIASGGVGSFVVTPDVAPAITREELSRRDGESADEFYRRIARAHRALSKVTTRPTKELARIARVPPGTGAAWVSRARARGMFDEEGE